jgi:hypothetical protein
MFGEKIKKVILEGLEEKLKPRSTLAVLMQDSLISKLNKA